MEFVHLEGKWERKLEKMFSANESVNRKVDKETINYLSKSKMVGLAGFEPTIFTQGQREAILYGFL